MVRRIVSSLIGMLVVQMFLLVASVIAFSTNDLERLDLINSCPYCDLTNAKLSGANLGDANLMGAALNYATLAKANLMNADLRGATLTQANLESADLTGANLANAHLHGANLSGTTLTNANLSGTVWTNGKRCKRGSVGACRQ